MIRSVVLLSPEPPYPLHGGGAYRIASLAHYFARFAEVDLVLFSEGGKPAELPPGLVRRQTAIALPRHRTDTGARYLRNARRALRGVPPLIDRLSGHEDEVARALSGRHYDLGIAEHFWCAPYLAQLSAACERTALDLHNIESVLHARCAETSRGLVAAGQRRFAGCAERLEKRLLPGYSLVLAASEPDARAARRIAPGINVAIYPNALPEAEIPRVREEPVVVFPGNFEYHPNIDAVGFLANSIWPEVRRRCPELRLRLVGRGDRFIRHLLPSGLGIETTGAVENARREIAAARIAIAPLRTGSGTRIKILESWAAARPVVATSLAAEGLEYRVGEPGGAEDRAGDIVIADTSLDFAGAIAELNADPARRASIGANGRRVYEERYTWQAAWRVLDANPLTSGAVTGSRYTGGSDANRR